jgi:tRNA 5-methylaminomethyl-2-thiouridine biosynthesis bifunctional protein
LTAANHHALVIGAGLAGAAVCIALARRGWHTTLIDAASGPAQAASALPVGMLSPHVTKAPTPLSRLSALGVADTRAELERLLLQGQGWQACEVDNRGHDPGRWPAALVRPGALVQAWLDEARQTAGLITVWNAPVARLRQGTICCTPNQTSAGWQALNAQGHVLAEAPVVVVAAALGSLALLQASAPELGATALPLRPVKGQMSLGAQHGPALAPRPQRDNGVFVPVYEDAGLAPEWPARVWTMGSTYLRGNASTTLSDADHERNALSLQAMVPEAAAQLRGACRAGHAVGLGAGALRFAGPPAAGGCGTRCDGAAQPHGTGGIAARPRGAGRHAALARPFHAGRTGLARAHAVALVRAVAGGPNRRWDYGNRGARPGAGAGPRSVCVAPGAQAAHTPSSAAPGRLTAAFYSRSIH